VPLICLKLPRASSSLGLRVCGSPNAETVGTSSVVRGAIEPGTKAAMEPGCVGGATGGPTGRRVGCVGGARTIEDTKVPGAVGKASCCVIVMGCVERDVPCAGAKEPGSVGRDIGGPTCRSAGCVGGATAMLMGCMEGDAPGAWRVDVGLATRSALSWATGSVCASKESAMKLGCGCKGRTTGGMPS
jgi:hypothetical protein